MRSLIIFLTFTALTSLLLAFPGEDSNMTLLEHEQYHQNRVIVKFDDASRIRLRENGFTSLAGKEMKHLQNILSGFSNPSVERLFTRQEEEIDKDIEEARQRSGKQLANLNSYYEFILAPNEIERFIRMMESLEIVQLAYPTPPPVPPPVDIPPTTPDFETGQRYLDPAPDGIDARTAWNYLGGKGEGVTIIDIEYDWNDTHEDLENALGQKLCYTPRGLYIDHGTAVLGEIGSSDNGYGVTGIVNQAGLGMVTQYPVGMSNSVARAIDCATSLLAAGDLILLEAQTGGPHGNYVPVEWNQAEYDAIAAATAKGIIVVEAAGNGNEDLDHPDYLGRFDRNVRDSGAIIVGAGAPPDYSQPDRSRLSFSTYGSRVDVQGYGQMVTTTGYGGLFNGGGDMNQYYTSTFSGTSSASPIVTGAAAAVQGTQIMRGGQPLDPTEVRRILTDTGTPQQNGPYSGHIGPRPDLSRALGELANLYVIDILVEDAAPLGNADGLLDPGESATLLLTIRNLGQEPATAITGSLSSNLEELLKITNRIADWPDLIPGASAGSLPPHHRMTAQPETFCGTRSRLTANLSSNPYTDMVFIDLDIGQKVDTFPSTNTPLAIPKNSSSGVSSTIEISETFTIQDVQATVDITHGDSGELQILLQSPSSTSVTLHNHTSSGTADLQTTYDRDTLPDGPGMMNDFNGESAQGSWTLRIVDDQGGPVKPGTLNSWSLELTAVGAIRCQPLSCIDPLPGPMDDSFQIAPAGEEDLLFTWMQQSGVTEYRIWSSLHASMEDAVMICQTPESSFVESGGLTSSEGLVFYQVRAVNVCNWEGP